MTISRVELQGAVTRTQDFATLKQNEDNKGMIDQTNFHKQFDQNINDQLHQVHEGEKAENRQKKFDAKEKGNGQYEGDGGKQNQKQKKPSDGKVILKQQHGFDIKI